MLSVNDFFSGCGGLSQGFKEAGFKIQVAVDKEEAFLKTFSHNFKDSQTRNLDLGDNNILKEIPESDIIIAGPPCQGFSLTGPRNIDDPRNKLYLSVFKTLKLTNPKAFVVENVRTAREELGLPPSSPTDAELECLAQTWSEHCSHKIFAARIHHVDRDTGEESTIDSLFKTHIMQPTLDIQKNVDWLLSIFHDNSGVIAWNDDWSLCIKAETHNSPSALDPYGGAITGIVGVNRDIVGTGLGARPIANTDVFCFGPPDWEGDLPENLFHPSRVLRGVHAGVRVGGNESGIPTVNGAIVFDDRYIGKPLVYCGTIGMMPRKLPDGRESHVKNPEPGDRVYMVGGRVGYDGIHGATFSSLELSVLLWLSSDEILSDSFAKSNNVFFTKFFSSFLYNSS